jgi:hypothetical protein
MMMSWITVPAVYAWMVFSMFTLVKLLHDPCQSDVSFLDRLRFNAFLILVAVSRRMYLPKITQRGARCLFFFSSGVVMIVRAC